MKTLHVNVKLDFVILHFLKKSFNCLSISSCTYWRNKICIDRTCLDFRLIFKEGRTGVFPWCGIGWFYFPWNVNLINYSSWSVIWRFCVTREELELLTDIRDFTTLFGVILRCECSGRLILRLKTSNVTSNRLRFN